MIENSSTIARLRKRVTPSSSVVIAPDEVVVNRHPSTDTKSAARALELFRLFSVARRALTLTEIADQLGAPKSSCFHLVRTLQHLGYLYALGPRKGFYPTKLIVHQSQTIAQHDPLLQLITKQLLRLRDQTSESVVVASLHEGAAMIIELVESPQGIRFTARIGEKRSLVDSSIGKALLGGMGREERSKALAKPKMGKDEVKTIAIDLKSLDKELASSAKRGWYTSKDKPHIGVSAVAIPVTVGGTLLAVAVVGPSARMSAKIAEHASALHECFTID